MNLFAKLDITYLKMRLLQWFVQLRKKDLLLNKKVEELGCNDQFLLKDKDLKPIRRQWVVLNKLNIFL